MAYQVDKFNGTFLVSVEDGTIDTTTDLRFVGKNYAGYGEVQNENFLHLLEHFANTSAPPKSITGQVWYDSGNKKLKFYDGSKYKNAGGAEVSANAPSGLAEGEFWWDSSAQQLYAWSGTDYVLVGPESAPDLGASSIVSQVVKDTLGINHSIGKLQSGGDVIAIISKDTFTLNSTVNPITGFSIIKKGFNLVNTNGTTGVTSDDHYYWGTSSNALKLGGYSADDFVRAGSANFNTAVAFGDSGYTIGDQKDIRFRIENGDEPVLENQLGNPITVRLRISDVDQRNVAIFTTTGIIPGTTEFYTLGSSTSKWTNVYSTTFTGSLTGNVTGNLTGVVTGNVISSADSSVLVDSAAKVFYGTLGSPSNLATVYGNLLGEVTGTASNAITLNGALSSVSASASTVTLRDTAGNITANRFIGVADTANRIKIDDAAVDTDASYRTAKTTATANTIAARTSSGNLVANVFEGTATSARYADLAEKYLTDADYEPGTVVVVGGDKEVTASSWGQRAIGAVSTNPAFMMNKDQEGGTYIALKGRVPVKVIGSIRKGDRLIAGNNGTAVAAVPHANDIFAIALETNDDTGVKLVEAVIL